MRKSIIGVGIVALLVFTAFLAITSGEVLAKGEYTSSFTAAYPNASALASCNLCHTASIPALNGYGQDWAAAGKNFQAIEGKDSDGDGVANGVEIAAGKSPADPSSKPATTPPPTTPPTTTQPPVVVTPPPSPAKVVDKSKKFWDLEDHWAKADATLVASLNIIKGYDDNSYGVNKNVTRAELAVIVLRTFGIPELKPNVSWFSDVKSSDWYYGAVHGAAGVVMTVGSDTFNPNGNADRATVIEGLVRGVGLTKKALAADEQAKALAAFKDAGTLTSAQATYVALAAQAGLVKGDSNGNINASAPVTRGELAAMIARLYTKPVAGAPATMATAYVGSDACKTCHADVYKNWKGTKHATMVQDAKSPTLWNISNFATNDSFQLSDVKYVVAQGQRFVDSKMMYMNRRWNAEARKWEVNTPSNWLTGCASCHTTGYDAKTKTFAEVGISCESCHGGGKRHVLAGGGVGTIKASVGNDSCDSCHGGDRQAGQIAETKHAVAFAELSKEAGYGDRCIKCHSATFMVAVDNGKTPPTWADFSKGALQNDRISITCVVCHDPHKYTNEAQLRKDKQATCTDCHTGSLAATATSFKPGAEAHHPQKEMWEGRGAVGVPNMPSKKSATCVDCHMVDGNHYFKVGTPEITLTSHGKPYQANSCIKCHPTMTKEDIEARQASVEAQMTKIADLLTKVKAKIDAAKAAGTDVTAVTDLYNAAFTNHSFMEADLSKGMHNPWYADAMLKVSIDNLTKADGLLP